MVPSCGELADGASCGERLQSLQVSQAPEGLEEAEASPLTLSCCFSCISQLQTSF